MKAKRHISLITGLILALIIPIMGCSASSAHEGMVRYNDEWLTQEEYAQAKSEPSLSFTVVNKEQGYYEALDKWDTFVTFNYNVENTGEYPIDYYEVSFTAKCNDGNGYYNWTNGTDIAAGETRTEELLIDVSGKEVTDISVNNWGVGPNAVLHGVSSSTDSSLTSDISRPQGPEPDTDFVIRVSGTEGLQFNGDYMAITSDGRSTSRSVSGSVPALYGVNGEIVSAMFQKDGEDGLLIVEIAQNGQVINWADSYAPYGVVSVTN